MRGSDEADARLGMRPLWPLGPGPVLIPAVAIGLLAINGSGARWGLPFQDWLATSSQFMQQLQFAGPVAAAAAAYSASRVVSPSRLFALRPSQRPPGQVVARLLGPLVAWFVGAYVVGMLPLVWLSYFRATADRLYAGPVLTGLLGLIAFTVLGFVLGAFVRSAAAVPVAFLLAFGVIVLGSRDVTRLSPFPSVGFSTGSIPSGPLMVVRLIVLTLVVLAGVSYLLRLMTGSRKVPLTALAALAGVATFAVIEAVSPPQVATVQSAPPSVCQRGETVEVCVHTGHSMQLESLLAAADAVVQGYQGSGGPTRLVYDSALGGDSQLNSPSALWVAMAPEIDPALQVPGELAGQLVSFEPCVERFGAFEEIPIEVTDLYSFVQQWITGGGVPIRDSESSYPHLRELDAPGMRQWLHDETSELQTCTVDLEALPQ